MYLVGKPECLIPSAVRISSVVNAAAAIAAKVASAVLGSVWIATEHLFWLSKLFTGPEFEFGADFCDNSTFGSRRATSTIIGSLAVWKAWIACSCVAFLRSWPLT